ncbi:phosphatase domain-containing putative toxin [Bdellovibrio bacteriovorus]|uniref:Tyrosine specific protein phosphatases domain-containing protein n=1 Tax=Bdellovibrio bacteriovorus str. Tiberius TaxID=1069642 RepID=K7YSB0_BDEBC|nr:tyrosine-protein phosphatase [Bdellovibrio bacteriovorus]AFY02786.1 Hypothetical protein Bdt_3111 [Bdellovibrio bacteriovorus str. Tiberius]
MKALLISFILLICSPAWSLQSAFGGTIEGLSIPNSHEVYSDASGARVVRGMEPRNKAQIHELLDSGIEEVLIFKTDTKGEVAKEITQLQNAGLSAAAITHVPFPWKDLHDYKAACRMTIEALKTIERSVKAGRSIYFHCTVGEDRTGYLAGLWGLWTGEFETAAQAFKTEMCARGYEAGNPRKPYKEVVAKIRETLTPTYLKMATVLTEARARGQNLHGSLCNQEPVIENAAAFRCVSKRN